MPEESRTTDRVLAAKLPTQGAAGRSRTRRVVPERADDISSNVRTQSEPGRRRCSTWNVKHRRATRSEGGNDSTIPRPTPGLADSMFHVERTLARRRTVGVRAGQNDGYRRGCRRRRNPGL